MRRFERCLASRGQLDTARPAVKQGRAKFGLELADRHGKRRLGDVQAFGGAVKILRVGQRGEIAQLL